MLHAATMLAGLVGLAALAITGDGDDRLWIISVLGLACLVVAMRFGGVSGAFARLPHHALWLASSAGAIVGGASATLRAALAADVTLKPALVRLKTRVEGADGRAVLAALISAAPGMVVVESDSEGLLVHVINEDSPDAARFGPMEAHALAMTTEASR